MRSSLRIFDSKTGEMIGSVMRTGEEEISRLSFSHNEVVKLRNEVPEGDGNYRVECWVGEEGGEFKAVVLDVFNVNGVYDGFFTRYDITAYGSFVENAPCCLFDRGGYFAEGKVEKSGSVFYLMFDGDTTNYSPCLAYWIEGRKGFLSVPVVGDFVFVNQEEGDRELFVRYFEEGDNV